MKTKTEHLFHHARAECGYSGVSKEREMVTKKRDHKLALARLRCSERLLTTEWKVITLKTGTYRIHRILSVSQPTSASDPVENCPCP